MPQSISEFVRGAKANPSVITEHAAKIAEEIEEKNPVYSHFNQFDKKIVLEQAREIEKKARKGFSGKLLGVPVSVKDCLCVKGVEAKARSEGAIILGKTAQDEFGFGTFSVNHTAGKVPLNPLDKERSCGGSSGGSAGFTALTNHTHVSIAESTGGSIACPASFCGVSSITPTYGVVSRYGLMDYANSLDKIGAMGKSIDDAFTLLQCISGLDVRDSTSLKSTLKKEKTGALKIGLPEELFDAIKDDAIKKTVLKNIHEAESLGASVQDVSLPLNTEYGIAAYYLIAMAEASTNLAKYCGMRYGLEEKLEGNFNEYFSRVRSRGFGEEAKRRILVGTFARMSGFRDAYYLRAMKARTKLISEFRVAFSKVDLLSFPSMPVVAPKFSEIEKLTPLESYSMDLCTVPANLCGLPHATINAGEVSGLPVGLMVVGAHLDDSRVASFAGALEALK